jgi:hypothetical protein
VVNYATLGAVDTNPRAIPTLLGDITLEKVTIVPGGQDRDVEAYFSWDQLVTAGGTDSLEILLTPGSDVFYELKVGFGDLSSELVNYSLTLGRTGDLPGPYDLGLPGSGSTGDELFANALGLEGDLVYTRPVPIPGSVVLLISGITALIGLRRRSR